MAPTLIASYFVQSTVQGTATLTTPSFTPSNGEVVVVKMETWDSGTSMGAPTGGSQTYTSRIIDAPGGFNPWVGIYTAVISGSPGSMTISSTPSLSARYSMTVERWSGAQLAATPVTASANSTSAPASGTITPSAGTSIISWTAGDDQSVDPATRAYLGSGTDEGVRDDHGGGNGVGYHGYQASTGTSSQSFGLSAPTGLKFGIVGIEIQAGSSTVNGTATIAGAGAVSALTRLSAIASLSGAGALAATVVQRATAGPAGAGSLTASSGGTVTGTASIAGAGALTAAAVQRATAAPAGAGSVSASVTQSALSAIAGAGALSAAAAGTVTGTAALAGTGGLSASVTQRATASPAGAGAVSSAGSNTGSAVLAGAGSLASTVRQQTPAALAGSGSLAAAGQVVIVGTAALVGAGFVTASTGSRITPRPFTGITSRPAAGTTTRPFAGITARP